MTGKFKIFISFLSIILVHELGHILGAILFKWSIEKIIILPFGGITLFNEKINKPIKEELIICLLGPIFQILYYLLVSNFLDIRTMHYNLLIFNLLPIIPLDGSKLLNLILNKLFSYSVSLSITNFISIFFIILFMFYMIICNKNLIVLIILLFLIIKTFREIKDKKYIINRFLLERFYYPIKTSKFKIISGKNINKMFRDYKHLFNVKSKYYTEREIIKKRFDLQEKM